MRRWGLALALLAAGCASAADADNLPPPSLAMPPTSGGDDDSGDGDGSEGSSSSDGEPADESGAPGDGSTDGGDGEGSSGGGDDSAADDSGGTPTCEPDPADTECFACGREKCCVQITACQANPVCNCALNCIQDGGMSDPCVEGCGGQNEQTINLFGCAYFQCPDLC